MSHQKQTVLSLPLQTRPQVQQKRCPPTLNQGCSTCQETSAEITSDIQGYVIKNFMPSHVSLILRKNQSPYHEDIQAAM